MEEKKKIRTVVVLGGPSVERELREKESIRKYILEELKRNPPVIIIRKELLNRIPIIPNISI